MPNLNIAIGQSKYTINCDAGEEEKVLNLAARLNERVNNLSLAMRGADEKTVLMLCALMAEEESDSARNQQNSVETSKVEKISTPKTDDENIKKIVEEKLIEQIESTIELVSKLAKKIDSL